MLTSRHKVMPDLTKHQKNAAKKADKLAKQGALRCPKCGKPTSKTCCDGTAPVGRDDRSFEQAENKHKRAILSSGPTVWPAQRSRRWGATPIRRADEKTMQSFDIPAWLRELYAMVSRSAGVPVDGLVYQGHSKALGKKAGKKAVKSHCFQVKEEYRTPSIQDGPIVTVWHGTPLRNAAGILNQGLKASISGLLGKGVYVGTKEKAWHYAAKGGGNWGVMLKCLVSMGRVAEAGERYAIPTTQDYDTLHCAPGTHKWAWGGSIAREEWCVRDPARVSIVEIHLVPLVKG